MSIGDGEGDGVVRRRRGPWPGWAARSARRRWRCWCGTWRPHDDAVGVLSTTARRGRGRPVCPGPPERSPFTSVWATATPGRCPGSAWGRPGLLGPRLQLAQQGEGGVGADLPMRVTTVPPLGGAGADQAHPLQEVVGAAGILQVLCPGVSGRSPPPVRGTRVVPRGEPGRRGPPPPAARAPVHAGDALAPVEEWSGRPRGRCGTPVGSAQGHGSTRPPGAGRPEGRGGEKAGLRRDAGVGRSRGLGTRGLRAAHRRVQRTPRRLPP